MQKFSFTASTAAADVFTAPLSGEGTLTAIDMDTPADGLQLQGAVAANTADADWVNLTDVTVLAEGDEINFRTDFRYLRVKPITGAVTAADIRCSGLAIGY